MKQIRQTALAWGICLVMVASIQTYASITDNLSPYVGVGGGFTWLNASKARGVYHVVLTDGQPMPFFVGARTFGLKQDSPSAEVVAGVAYQSKYFILDAEGFVDPLPVEAKASGDYDFIQPAGSIHITTESTLKLKYSYGLRLLPQLCLGHRLRLLGSLGVTFAKIKLQGAGTINITPFNNILPDTADSPTTSKTVGGLAVGGGGAVKITNHLSLRGLFTVTWFNTKLNARKINRIDVVPPEEYGMPSFSLFSLDLQTERGRIPLKQLMVSLVYRFTTA